MGSEVGGQIKLAIVTVGTQAEDGSPLSLILYSACRAIW